MLVGTQYQEEVGLLVDQQLQKKKTMNDVIIYRGTYWWVDPVA